MTQDTPQPGPTGQDDEKRVAAEAAADLAEAGMTLGLGTGTTVAHLLPALARTGDALGLPLRPLRLLLGRNRHDTARARAALQPLGIACPPFASYARRVVAGYLNKAA